MPVNDPRQVTLDLLDDDEAVEAMRQLDDEPWLTRFTIPDPEDDDPGPGLYTIIIRGPNDEERMTRKERQELWGEESALRWTRIDDRSPEEYAAAFIELLEDETPRTFNQLVLEVTGYGFTADQAFGRNPFWGLRQAVADGRLMITNQAPIYVAIADERAIEIEEDPE